MIVIDTSDVRLAFDSLESAARVMPTEFRRVWRQVGPQMLAHVRKMFRKGALPPKAGVTWSPLHPLTLRMRRMRKRWTGTDFGGVLPSLMKYEAGETSVRIGYVNSRVSDYIDRFQLGDVTEFRNRKLARSKYLLDNLDKATTAQKRKAMFALGQMLRREAAAMQGKSRQLFAPLSGTEELAQYAEKTFVDRMVRLLNRKYHPKPRAMIAAGVNP